MKNNSEKISAFEIPFTLNFAKVATNSKEFVEPKPLFKINLYNPKLQRSSIQAEGRQTQDQYETGKNADGTIHWDWFTKHDDY